MEEESPRNGIRSVPTNFAIQGPKNVPRVDYDRVFVLDEEMKLLGEYVLRDDCPLDYDDLRRSIPVSGMRHLLSFYQGQYVFTPFRVDGLWFVVLSRGVPRIEDRGSIGTLLAAMRVHLPPTLSPTLAARDAAIRNRERELDVREAALTRREQRIVHLEAELDVATKKLNEREIELHARESRQNALRDYALHMQRAFRPGDSDIDAPVGERRDTRKGRSPAPPPP